MATNKKTAKSGASSALTSKNIPGTVADPDILKNQLPSGFVDEANYTAPEGMIVRSMAPMIKPADWPVGKVLVGKFTKIFETNPTAKKKGEGIEIMPKGASVGVAVPAVATIRQGLEMQGNGAEATSEYLGRYIAIKKLEARLPSKKGQAAWHFVIAIYPEGFGG